MDIKATFDRIRNERTSESGRACVELALAVIATTDKAGNITGITGDTVRLTEARSWLKTALAHDTAIADGNLAEALEKAKKKAGIGGKLDEAKRVAAGNVVSMKRGT